MEVDVVVFPSFSPGPPRIAAVSPVDTFTQLLASIANRCSIEAADELLRVSNTRPSVSIRVCDDASTIDLLQSLIPSLETVGTPQGRWADRDELRRAGFAESAVGVQFGQRWVLWNALTGCGLRVDGALSSETIEGALKSSLLNLGLITE